MEEIDSLRKHLDRMEAPDESLRSFSDLPRMKYAFFPGGDGLYLGPQAKRYPRNGVLILGSNFGCKNGFINEFDELRCTDERANPTWTGMLELLKHSEIEVDGCFFTNAWPFLHVGTKNLSEYVGRWLKSQQVMARCLEFFNVTYLSLQPRLIIALGTGPAAFLSHFWRDPLPHWRKYRWADVDQGPVVEVPNAAVCVAITHPSMPNRRHRSESYRTFAGEAQLVKEAARLAKL